MIIKIITYASFIVAANAYLSHQHPVAPPVIPHTPYYGHNEINGHYGYHGQYIGNNYGHVLPHHQPAVNPWLVSPGVHGDNVNLHPGLYRPHAPVQNYGHSTALAPAQPVPHVSHNNNIVPPSIRIVNQAAPVRPINYQHRQIIPPVFSHHTSMFQHDEFQHNQGLQNHGNWAW